MSWSYASASGKYLSCSAYHGPVQTRSVLHWLQKCIENLNNVGIEAMGAIDCLIFNHPSDDGLMGLNSRDLLECLPTAMTTSTNDIHP